ncbi:MAG: hypothetical protein ABR511_03070 [Acidimicrobiales bacterium]
MSHYQARVVRPLREARGLLPAEAVPYQVSGVHLRLRPKLMGYWIPLIAGLGLMVAGMKTAGSPFVSIPQLVIGIALLGVGAWDLVTDFGLLDFDLRPRRMLELPPGPPAPPVVDEPVAASVVDPTG